MRLNRLRDVKKIMDKLMIVFLQIYTSPKKTVKQKTGALGKTKEANCSDWCECRKKLQMKR